MKKFMYLALASGLAVGVFAVPSEAQASARTFKNCTAMHKVYKHGVAKSSAAANKQKHRPKVSASIYKANQKMDRDKDGTACEA